jgi:hypothetical protein
VLLTHRVLKDLKIVRNFFDLFASINVGLEHIIVHLSGRLRFGRTDTCYPETHHTTP